MKSQSLGDRTHRIACCSHTWKHFVLFEIIIIFTPHIGSIDEQLLISSIESLFRNRQYHFNTTMKFSRKLLSLIAIAPAANAFMASSSARSATSLKDSPAPFYTSDIAAALDKEVRLLLLT